VIEARRDLLGEGRSSFPQQHTRKSLRRVRTHQHHPIKGEPFISNLSSVVAHVRRMQNADKKCPVCDRTMLLDVSIASMTVPGRTVLFFSCNCGAADVENRDRVAPVLTLLQAS
jgi:hypothetical protein